MPEPRTTESLTVSPPQLLPAQKSETPCSQEFLPWSSYKSPEPEHQVFRLQPPPPRNKKKFTTSHWHSPSELRLLAAPPDQARLSPVPRGKGAPPLSFGPPPGNSTHRLTASGGSELDSALQLGAGSFLRLQSNRGMRQEQGAGQRPARAAGSRRRTAWARKSSRESSPDPHSSSGSSRTPWGAGAIFPHPPAWTQPRGAAN